MLLFRACIGTEVEVQLGPDSWARHSELPMARAFYWSHIERWMEMFSISRENVIHAFTHGRGFRAELMPTYKCDRKGKPKPIGYSHLRAEILSEDFAMMFSQIEADDVIGILATMPEVVDEGYVIASGDKDLRQIPGLHIWMSTTKDPTDEGLKVQVEDEYTAISVSNEYAQRFTYQQYLSGDPTDSIPGCPGIGDARAKAIVSEFDISKPVDCWEKVVQVYQQKGKVEQPFDTALQQARLARILRAGEYNFDSHTVIPWNPPTLTNA